MNTQIQNQKKTNNFRAPCRPLGFWALGFDSDFWFRILGFILAVAICSPLRADPGLVGEYFVDIYNMKQMDQLKKEKEPFLVRTDPQIDFKSVEGDFYGSHLTINFGVRWTGTIHIDKPGKYTFHLASDDGSKLFVNNKEVIAFKKLKPMEDTAGDFTFDTAGDFPLKLIFNQMGGEAGCILSWQTPDSDKVEVIPADVLSHDKAAENIKWDKADFDLFATDHHAWIKKHGKPYEKMDYGPFLSGTFKAPFPENNTTLKGIIVSLNKEHNTNILFDTEMCRYSAGWTSENGEFIDYHGVAYDGSHGVTPSIKGKQIFGTPNMPGWEHDGSWKDPRKVPYGNLPAEWCHYRGLYRCGDQVVLSYTVNGVGILDLPGCETVGDEVFVTRTLQVDPSKSPLKLLVSSSADTLDFKAPMGVEISFDKVLSNTYATIPAHDAPAQYTIVIMAAKPGLHAKPHDGYVIGKPVDFDSFLKGGPARWGAPIETKGTLGKDDGPYTVDTITPPTSTPFDSWMRISGFDFFPDGHSAAVCTWNGDVWIVKGIDDKLDHLTWQRYASGLFQTLGLKIVNGDVYVSGRDQITRLHDLNGDGEADFYENFNNDCEVTAGFHEFQHDLETDSEGNFYYAKGGPVRPGGNGFEAQSEDNGCVMKVSPDGKKCEIYATGMRAPNGMSMGPNDMLTVSDNQGTWVPACRISFVTKGSFLGVPDTSHMTPKPDNYGNPICWFPYPGEGNAITDNSSGGAAWDNYGKWGPMDGRLIHLSYGTCSLFEMMFENVDGIWQGGCVKFPLDFDSGLMRARFNPIDGQLYVAGLKGWQTTAAKDGCFQRVRYTGKPVHMPTELHVLKDGIAITFTSPVDPKAAVDTDNWNIEDYNYIWSSAYGSPEVTRDNPKKKGHDVMDISAIDVSPDHKTVTIHITDLKPVMQMKTLMKIKAEDGSPMNWEIDSTINIVPGQTPIAVRQPTAH